MATDCGAEPLSQEETQALNAAFFEKLSSPDAAFTALEKQAVDAVNDFTRARIREGYLTEKLRRALLAAWEPTSLS